MGRNDEKGTKEETRQRETLELKPEEHLPKMGDPAWFFLYANLLAGGKP